jgi:NitT/TauT family transport system substrate-binding protein
MAVWMAEELGLFQKYSFKAEVTHLTGATLGQAMAAGEVQIGICAGNTAVSSVAHGGEIVFVAGLTNNLIGNLWVMADSPINRVQDLRGKAIGISTLGSLTQLVARAILDEHGMSARDVTLRPLGSSPARLAGLERGLVDAAILLTFGAGVAKRLKSIYDTASLKISLPVTSVLSTKRFIRRSPEDVGSAIKALAEAVAFIHRPPNKNRVISTLRARLKLKSLEEAESFYETTMRTFDPTHAIPVRGVEAFITMLAEEDPAVAKLKVEDVVDFRFVRNLQESGFLKNLY